MKSVCVLGSTGSVGRNTLEVMAENPDHFSLYGVCAQKNVTLLARQIMDHKPQIAVIGDERHYRALKDITAGTKTHIAAGRDAVLALAMDSTPQITVGAIVGMAGLAPLFVALKTKGRIIAVANKEPLIAAGPLMVETARAHGSILLPLDSEHNAIFQCLAGQDRASVRRVILTASGGPFRQTPIEDFATITPEQALKHPTWSMGPKISIDSATMMNKALEVIEAHHLFNLPPDQIDVVIHPQSVIHSMVEFIDGSLLAQMGPSDMKVPIRHCLGWPNRLKNESEPFDFYKYSSLTFERPDHRRFPAIKLAYDSLHAGASACIALNAINEIAVNAFLLGEIPYTAIMAVVEQGLDAAGAYAQTFSNEGGLDPILAFDNNMRSIAQDLITKHRFSPRKAL